MTQDQDVDTPPATIRGRCPHCGKRVEFDFSDGQDDGSLLYTGECDDCGTVELVEK
jgi:hypothetical protein